RHFFRNLGLPDELPGVLRNDSGFHFRRVVSTRSHPQLAGRNSEQHSVHNSLLSGSVISGHVPVQLLHRDQHYRMVAVVASAARGRTSQEGIKGESDPAFRGDRYCRTCCRGTISHGNIRLQTSRTTSCVIERTQLVSVSRFLRDRHVYSCCLCRDSKEN